MNLEENLNKILSKYDELQKKVNIEDLFDYLCAPTRIKF